MHENQKLWDKTLRLPYLRSSANHFSTDENLRHYSMGGALQERRYEPSWVKTFQKPSQGLTEGGLPSHLPPHSTTLGKCSLYRCYSRRASLWAQLWGPWQEDDQPFTFKQTRGKYMIVTNKMKISDGEGFAFQSPNAANQHIHSVFAIFQPRCREKDRSTLSWVTTGQEAKAWSELKDPFIQGYAAS